MYKTLFLVFSACIVVFSLISICTAPIINFVLLEAYTGSWSTQNCKLLEDEYKRIKDNENYPNRDKALEDKKKEKNKCNREKAMYDLEYSSLILDITLGFICAVLGLLHFFDVAKPFEKITGIIGLSTGVIIFVLTFVYVCYSGYIFTNHRTNVMKLNKEAAYAKREIEGGVTKFKCLYYKSDNVDSVYATFSELGNRAYNYDKKREYPEDNSNYANCRLSNNKCLEQEYVSDSRLSNYVNCDYLYSYSPNDFKNKYLFDMWVTTIIFSCFIFVCAIGLAIFGFLLFNSSDGSGL